MSDLQQVKVLMQGQRWAEAKVLCAGICQTGGNKDAEAWFLLGAIHGQLGAFDEAEKCCRQALALRPDVPVIVFNLGIALQKQEKLKEAIDCFRRAISLNPSYAEAHNELGVTLQMSGVDQLDAAVEFYRKALEIKPGYPEAHYNRAAGLRALGKNTEACENFKEALRLQPGMWKASSAYAMLLRELGDDEQRVAVLESGIRHNPDNPDLRYQLGKTMLHVGRYHEALDIFNHLLALGQDNESASAGCALVLERLGEFEKAYSLLQPFLEGTEDIAVGMAYAALGKHIDRRAEAATLLERLLLNGKADNASQQAGYFALGKLYDELKEYDRAFACFQNAIAVGGLQCDLDTHEREFSAIMTVFNVESIQRRPRATNKSRLPIFIVGMPRSGTTLVEQILSSHSEVYGAGELKDLSNISVAIPKHLNRNIPYPYCVDAIKRKQIDEIAGSHLAKLGAFSCGATRVTDKMPHNFLHLGLIDMLFPGARVIHCMRNPMDNCLSIYTQHFNANHSYAFNLAALGAYYRLYQKMMGHWKQALRIPILDVQYEDMVANQEEESRRLVEFCGLQWEERCLDFHKNRRSVNTFSYDQVRRPIYKKSVERWKNYERHLGPLISALGEDAKGVTGEEDGAESGC